MKRMVLAVVVIVIAVVGAWWWRSARSVSPPAATSGAPARDDATVRRAPAHGSDAPDPRPRAMIDDDPAGTLRLEGQVVDASGHGVGGAVVAITATPPRTVVTEA